MNYIISVLDILGIIHKGVVIKPNKEELKKELEVLKSFRYLYLIFFIFGCVITFWTNCPPCLVFIFLPFVGVFSPVAKRFKDGFILIKYKEFYLLLLFSCIFSIFVFMLYKGHNIIYTVEFILWIICLISFIILYFRNCWLKFNNLKPNNISNVLMILFGLMCLLLLCIVLL